MSGIIGNSVRKNMGQPNEAHQKMMQTPPDSLASVISNGSAEKRANEIRTDINRLKRVKSAQISSNNRRNQIQDDQRLSDETTKRHKSIRAEMDRICDLDNISRPYPKVRAAASRPNYLTPAAPYPLPKNDNMAIRIRKCLFNGVRIFGVRKTFPCDSENEILDSDTESQFFSEERPLERSNKFSLKSISGKIKPSSMTMETHKNILSTVKGKSPKETHKGNDFLGSSQPKKGLNMRFKIVLFAKLGRKIKPAVTSRTRNSRSLTGESHEDDISRIREICNIKRGLNVCGTAKSGGVQRKRLEELSSTPGGSLNSMPKSEIEEPTGRLEQSRKFQWLDLLKAKFCAINERLRIKLRHNRNKDSPNYELYSGKDLIKYLKFCQNEKKLYKREYMAVGELDVACNSEVKLMLDMVQKKLVVSKKIYLNRCWTVVYSTVQKKYLPMEIYAARLLSGRDQFVGLDGFLDFGNCIVMLTDFYGSDWVDLSIFVERNAVRTVTRAYKIFKNIVEATAIIHDLGMLHNDLKRENIVVNSRTLKVKILDFGSATVLTDREEITSQFMGTMSYACPEGISEKFFLPLAQESWTLGCILYSLVYGCHPFDTVQEILEKDIDLVVNETPHNLKEDQDENCGEKPLNDMKALIRVLLNRYYRVRPSPKRLKEIIFSKTVRDIYLEYYED